MERFSRVHKVLILITVITVFLMTTQVIAGIILDSSRMSPPLSITPIEEEFPESHFGANQDSIGLRAGNRYPAGLEYNQKTAEIQANPVVQSEVQNDKMPNSAANQNPTPSAIGRTGVQEVSLIVGDLGFFPKTLFVTRDIPVRLFVTAVSKKSLCFMMDSFQIRKKVHPQKIEEILFTPSTPGQFRFYCPVTGMEGTLLVKQ